ncbi:MAG: DUF3793 family protein [Eubacteriales bacterium]|nr:DUF3793 family protein [Eubacteriales bacterium]MDY3332212.1 DUF3793 family protein [Gallibacter sp.]
MPEELIIEQCAPTLAGIKTANLFPFRYTDRKVLFEKIREFNKSLSNKGIKMIPVKVKDGFALIYMYRPKMLETDLSNELAIKVLNSFGYSCSCSGKCIAELMRRLQTSDMFPHEIGFFLGYPPEDVKGFIENQSGESKCVGCWKVYGDVCSAQKRFDKYKKCTHVYKEQYKNGKSIQRLTVAV